MSVLPAGAQRQQSAALSHQDCLQRPIDGDFLIISQRAVRVRIARSQKLLRRSPILQAEPGALPSPKLVRRREVRPCRFLTREIVELDDVAPVGRISELEPKDLGIVLRLLQPVRRLLVARLGFNDRDWVVGPVPEDVVGTLLLAPSRRTGNERHPSVGKGSLLVDRVRRVIPPRTLQQWNDQLAAGVGFGIQRCAAKSVIGKSILQKTIDNVSYREMRCMTIRKMAPLAWC